MLPNDVILLLKQVANSGFAPLDLMAEDLLKRYVPQVGPSEVKEFETWAMLTDWNDDEK